MLVLVLNVGDVVVDNNRVICGSRLQVALESQLQEARLETASSQQALAEAVSAAASAEEAAEARVRTEVSHRHWMKTYVNTYYFMNRAALRRMPPILDGLYMCTVFISRATNSFGSDVHFETKKKLLNTSAVSFDKLRVDTLLGNLRDTSNFAFYCFTR